MYCLQTLVSWFLISAFWSACQASKDAYFRSADYNAGKYGTHVTQSFRSSPVKAVQLNFMRPFTACDDGSKLFIAPRGNSIKQDSAPMIFDASGHFIWTPEHKYGQVYNFQVQQYKGEPYLIFWAGNDAVDGHGNGHYYMLDKHYELYKRIGAANHLPADLHVFTITTDGTALCSIYQTIETDVPAGHGTARGYVWDTLFQELDLETGEAIFEWRASEHFAFGDSYIHSNGATRKKPWDFFHLNMVEKDDLGNYLVSSRHLRAVIYVDGKTGDVLWQLGGKRNSFEDLSGGRATTFVGQHDAHWADGRSAITFFDNRADWQETVERHSKGTRIAVDLINMTARVEATYANPNRILSISQGSYQTLPSGNVLIGYGYNGVMTEFAPNGTVLCDAWFMPQTRFGSGDVQSYRNLKFDWTGLPRTPPGLVYEDSAFYVSWLGATEVQHWVLYDCIADDGEFNVLISFAKHGFETVFRLQPNQPIRQYVRAVALDRDGRQLGTSLTVDMGNRTNVFEADDDVEDLDEYEESAAELEDVRLLIGFSVAAFISGLLIAWLSIGRNRVGYQTLGFANQTVNPADDVKQPWIFRSTGVWDRLRSGAHSVHQWRWFFHRSHAMGGDLDGESLLHDSVEMQRTIDPSEDPSA